MVEKNAGGENLRRNSMSSALGMLDLKFLWDIQEKILGG